MNSSVTFFIYLKKEKKMSQWLYSDIETIRVAFFDQ